MTPALEELATAYDMLDEATAALAAANTTERDIYLRTFDPDAERPTVIEVARYNVQREAAMRDYATVRAQVNDALIEVQIAYLDHVR